MPSVAKKRYPGAVPASPSHRADSETGIFAIVGNDDGLVREKALLLYNHLTGGVDDGFTHETIDGTSENSDSAFEICRTVAQALQTLPMFGGDKVVWLRNANFFADTITGRSQRTEEGVEMLRAAMESGLPAGVKFLLTATEIDKRRAFWKFLEKSASVEICDGVDTSRDDWQDQAARLTLQRADELRLEFERDALALFVMLAGAQTRQIDNELDKLDLFLGPNRRLVTEDDVRLMVPLSREAVVFEIGKAIQKGNPQLAIRLIDEQLESGENAVGIMRASVIGVVRNLFLARLVIDTFKAPTQSYQAFAGAINRVPEPDRNWLPLKKDGSGVSVYPIFLAAEYATHFTLDGLRRVLEATHRADKALVTTGLDPRMVLHRVIAEIAAARIPGKPTGQRNASRSQPQPYQRR